MSNDAQQLAAIVLACSLAFAIAGCKKNPFGERSSEVVGIAQVPAPVKATIDRQAGGRAIGEIEKQTQNGRVRYEVTLGSGSDKSTVLIGQDGQQIADEDDD
ncbi:MAG: hypothetical protein QM625_23415 [Ralstonia sp.]|mgnify:CR=1 FL=1|jgi:hypothetical protein|uniref:PepSY domain-containing protein n=1 Tax=Ralstonia pickettii TaxID=329 RepID=A0AAW4QA78_RALPI|nr:MULTISPECIES: hypothetical protein [Ralstonia]MEE2979477.1 hypothetical protein [Pseudomonadota bacterium]NOZ18018.1 hypothetical protein [Betaproteobacteria bacterium]AJW47602.1 hypothetical protein TK49_23035 [Ralstonia mannitolilytica]MBA4202235.1 hypothetical protein [Ralstonia sp.]MBA4232906.1 hypothetical protein [Ralstonia sp.]